MKTTNNILKTFLISLLIGLALGVICVVYHSPKRSYTTIEKSIKTHNEIKESLKHPYHPTISKPSSSQIGVFAGDSVRVIPK